MNLCIHVATTYLKGLMISDIVLDIQLNPGEAHPILKNRLIAILYQVTNFAAQLFYHMVTGI